MNRFLFATLLLATALVAPALAQMPPTMPPGMPPASMPALPPGHPSLEAMADAAPATAPATSTQPAVPGTLTLHVVPGTKGGAPVAKAIVNITIYHEGQAIGKHEVTLDANGAATINFPISVACQPLVTTTYAGISQDADGPIFDRDHPTQPMEMKVYETTTTAPAWNVAMRHVMVTPGENGGIGVTEMLAVNNPSDRIWLGTGKDPNLTTLAIKLPEGISEIGLGGGFSGEPRTRIDQGALTEGSPLMPGQTRFRFSYVLPVKGGKAAISTVAPAPVDNMIVFVPEGLATVNAQGLTPMGAQAMGPGPKYLVFRGTTLPAGHSATLNLSNVVLPTAAAAPDQTTTATGGSAKHLAVIGLIGLVIVGLGAMLMRKPKAPAGK